MATTSVTLTETVAVAPAGGVLTQRSASLAEVVVVAPTQGRRWALHAALRATLRVASTPAAASVFAVALRSAVAIGGSWRIGYRVALRAGLRVGSAMRVRQALTLRETLRVRPAGGVTGIFHRTSSGAIRLADHLPNMRLGAVLRSVLRVAGTATGLRRLTAARTETVELHDVLAKQLTITVLSHDAVLIHDATLLTSIYSGTLADAVDFIVDTVSPAGDTTTWAINVRTGAVTEYLNYSFNSFARSANGTYLGAGDDGLFELAGPDDAGTPVIADIISGLVDFSGSFLSGMQAAYLAVRGSGEFFLKLTEATGRTVTYQVKATSLRTARINVGKGLRARYFTYELISIGQDFDLLDLTFLPIQQTRRI